MISSSIAQVGLRVEEAVVPARARCAHGDGELARAVQGEAAAMSDPLLHRDQGAGSKVSRHGALHRSNG